MKVAILDFATPFPGMEDYATAGQLIRDWLSPALPEAEMTIIKVALGQALPAIPDFDAYVLSGSEKGVYDHTAWMDALRAFLLDAKRAGKPLVGICFGHQIMADTFGGRAEKVPFGMVIGAEPYEIDGVVQEAHVWHQDQVVTVPPDAEVTGHAPYCPVGVLEYSFPGYSVQFHPEYTGEFLAKEIAVATGTVLTPEESQKALASIAAGHVAADLVAAKAAETLRRASS